MHLAIWHVGLIESLAIQARIDHLRTLESSFYKIFKRTKKVCMLYLLPGRDELLYGTEKKLFIPNSKYLGRTSCSKSIPLRIPIITWE